MYSHLAHSRRVHILGLSTESNLVLDQCSCSKTSGMVFCVSKGHGPLGGSLTYQVLRMNTVHPKARMELQLSGGRVNRLGRSDYHIGRILLDCQSQLRQKGLCRKRRFSLCLISNPLTLSHDGIVVVPLQAYIRVDQSEQFKHEFGPKLGGATITQNIYHISLVDNFR